MGRAGREAIGSLRPEQVAADFDQLLQQLASRNPHPAPPEAGTNGTSPETNREVA
jgi:hypothetical protein